MSKARRRHRITELLKEHLVTKQTELKNLLENENFKVTQATVSRDLGELGAVKVRVVGGQTVYAIPELSLNRSASQDHLRRVLGEWVAEISHSANLVVLRTTPGSAHVVASAFDRAGMPEIIGTVAGDDTLIIVVAEEVGGAYFKKHLLQLAGIEQP